MDAEAFPSQTRLYCLQKCNIFTIAWYMLNNTVQNLYWLKQIEKKKDVCISLCDYSTTIFKLMGSMLDFFYDVVMLLLHCTQHTANKLEISITNSAMKFIYSRILGSSRSVIWCFVATVGTHSIVISIILNENNSKWSSLSLCQVSLTFSQGYFLKNI